MMNLGFVASAEIYIQQLQEEGRMSAAKNQTSVLRRFIAYLGKKEIPFKDFDAVLIRNYHTWLERQELGTNTVSVYMRNLKHLYRQVAEANGQEVENLFKNINSSYRMKQDRNVLTLSEIKKLRKMDLSNERPFVSVSRDFFLFAVLAHGMAGGDIFYLTTDNIHGGELTYEVHATGKEVTIPWEPVMQEIVDRYKRPDSPYLFPLIDAADEEDRYRQHTQTLQRINRQLHKLGELLDLPFNLNMTVARHSWSSMMQSVPVSKLI